MPLRRRLASAERFRERAMARGLPDLKIDSRRSRASLCAITPADQRRPVVLRALGVLVAPDFFLALDFLPAFARWARLVAFARLARVRVPLLLLLVAFMRNCEQQYSCQRGGWHAGACQQTNA